MRCALYSVTDDNPKRFFMYYHNSNWKQSPRIHKCEHCTILAKCHFNFVLASICISMICTLQQYTLYLRHCIHNVNIKMFFDKIYSRKYLITVCTIFTVEYPFTCLSISKTVKYKHFINLFCNTFITHENLLYKLYSTIYKYNDWAYFGKHVINLTWLQ